MTEPNETWAQIGLAHVHFWGGVFFAAMAAVSFAAVAYHLEKSGLMPKRRTAIEMAEEVVRAVQ